MKPQHASNGFFATNVTKAIATWWKSYRHMALRRKPATNLCNRLCVEILEDRTLPQASPLWLALGPQPQQDANGIVNGSHVNGNVSGRATSLAVLSDAAGQPGALLVGTAGGGIWETSEMNANGEFADSPVWTPVGDQLYTDASLQTPIPASQAPIGINSIGSIAEDPAAQCANVVYAGTGEANNSADSQGGAGILKSLDGGEHWFLDGTGSTSNPSAFVGRAISKIIVTPDNTVFAAVVGPTGIPIASDGVYRSTDGGASWEKLQIGTLGTGGMGAPMGTVADVVTDLEYTQVGGNTVIYAALGNPARSPFVSSTRVGIWKSTDNGQTWAQVWNGGNNSIVTAQNIGRIALASSRSATDGTLYAAVSSTANLPTEATLAGVVSTNNAGVT